MFINLIVFFLTKLFKIFFNLECPYECEIINYADAIRAHGNALKCAQRNEIARFEVFLGNSNNRSELDIVISGYIILRQLCCNKNII